LWLRCKGLSVVLVVVDLYFFLSLWFSRGDLVELWCVIIVVVADPIIVRVDFILINIQ